VYFAYLTLHVTFLSSRRIFARAPVLIVGERKESESREFSSVKSLGPLVQPRHLLQLNSGLINRTQHSEKCQRGGL